jgi:hypothetical protein
MPIRLHQQVAYVIPALILSILMLLPARADPSDKAGWSVATHPRKRAFLKYIPSNDGPRLLVLGCLRDVDSFLVLSEHEPGTVPANVTLTLTLANGAAEQFAVQGKSGPNGIGVGRPGFSSEFDVDANERGNLRRKILAVLEGKGPIVLTVGSWSQNLPTSGLAEVLGRFKAICFE